MSTHSVAEAERKLSELIERALDGENVVITRDDKPLVELTPVGRARSKTKAKSKPAVIEAEQDLIEVLRSIPKDIRDAAGTEVSKMRDEEWER